MREPARGATLDEIESIYRTRLPEFRRVAAAIVGDRELALDAVQEGFALAIRERASFRGDGALAAWLWRIVVNAARARQRRRTPDASGTGEAAARNDGHCAEGADEVRGAISLLPERQRLVLFLRYYADLDYAAIADVLELSAGTVGADRVATAGDHAMGLDGRELGLSPQETLPAVRPSGALTPPGGGSSFQDLNRVSGW